jgi:hypothetical protein
VLVRASVAVACLLVELIPAAVDAHDEALTPVWRTLYPLPGLEITALTHDGARFVGIGGGRVAFSDSRVVLRSSDGLTWVMERLVDLPFDSWAESMAWGDDRYLAVGYDSCFTSTDAVSWTASGVGAFGQDVPAIPVERAVEVGQTAILVGLAESCDPAAGFRTNLGLVNLSRAPIIVSVVASHGDGTPISGVDLELSPNGNLQRDRLLAALGACDVRTGVVVVSSATPGARVLAFASVVDNSTGDPVLVAAGAPSRDL